MATHPRTPRPTVRRLVGLLGVSVLVGGLMATSAGSAGAAPDSPGFTGLSNAKAEQTTHNRDAKSGQPSRPETTGRYIVELRDEPVGAYDGGVPGLAPTQPRSGGKLDVNRADVKRYGSYLDKQRSAVLASAGVSDPGQVYTTAFNGFATALSGAQRAALASDPRVARVSPARWFDKLTVTTPNLLGLTAPGGPWAQLGGTGRDGAGKSVIIGDLDTGIWPESAAFSGGPAETIPGWHGICQDGEQWPSSTCNDKLIGARYFPNGFLDAVGELPDGEILSARDADGHGTHTASTAAGNFGPHAVVGSHDFGAVSGMAPAARIAAYKVLWGGSGTEDDIIAAVDQAVMDGVDVINYSIGPRGGEDTAVSPISEAFMFAARAGVFIAAAAGNDFNAGTLSNTFPWVTTTAAAIHSPYEATLQLGNGRRLVGLTLDPVLPVTTPIVNGADSGFPGEFNADICGEGTLDPAKVGGRLVVCQFFDPAATVQELRDKDARGVVFHVGGEGVRFNDIVDFPSIYLPNFDRVQQLLAYIEANPGAATARLLAGGDGSTAAGFPTVSDFSSRGPNQVDGNLLKPDITAPGTDVIAAVSPLGHNGRDWDVSSGTSMATPHIAGIAALIKDAHPDWSPSAIRSALMTTAGATVGSTSAFEQGAGYVRPASALDPGVVLEATPQQWFNYQFTSTHDGSLVNGPSIALSRLSGTVTITRTMRSVSAQREVYDLGIEGMDDLGVSVVPTRVALNPGQSATFRVTISRGTAPFDTYTQGALIWSSDTHSARIPVAVQPFGMTAPAQANGSGATGQTQFTVNTGFSGQLGTEFAGLQTGTDRTGTVPDDPQNSFTPGGAGTVSFPVSVPAGTPVLDLQLRGLTGNDIDLYLLRGNTQVGASLGLTATESITLRNPQAGSYTAWIHGFSTAGGQPTPFTLTTLALGTADEGNTTVTVIPQPVVAGSPVTVRAAWTGLAPSRIYFGQVAFSFEGTPLSRVLVRVSTPAAPAAAPPTAKGQGPRVITRPVVAAL